MSAPDRASGDPPVSTRTEQVARRRRHVRPRPPLRSHWLPGLLALAAVALAGVGGSTDGEGRMEGLRRAESATGQDSFPHLAHEGLFPLCTGCHEGIPTGDDATAYPAADSCDGCHDGEEVAVVTWSPPPLDRKPDNLAFSHPDHVAGVADAGDDPLRCASCHAPAGGERMRIDPLEAGASCLGCHAHEAEVHVADAECTTCHLPLAETSLPVERIAAFEEPPSHEGGAFVLDEHGPEADTGVSACATCHTRDSCTSCHVGGAEETLGRIAEAPAGMTLPPYEPVYPEPPTHEARFFEEEHGRLVVSDRAAECVTCHTRDDCASCHLPPMPRGARELPVRGSVAAPGVGLEAEAPATHDSPFFETDHQIMAAADPEGCASCHTRPFCASCHEAPARPVFHPENFLTRHSADAWGSMSECVNCHQTEVSCRACHVQSGLTGRGRLGEGYHDAEPVWLLRHAQAARQSLEACASCHTQRECLQCHSEFGSFQVNPHGPGFDPERAHDRNAAICRTCHIGDPLGRGGR